MSVSEHRKNLGKIKRIITRACNRVGRNKEDVQILIISRNRQVPQIREVVDAGCRLFGESRVQEAIQKISFFDEEIEWHLIGHLQSVKAKAFLKFFSLVHTVDSLRIGFDLQRACEKLDKEANILLQVKIANPDAQFGVEPSETLNLVKELVKFPYVKIRGLMTEVPQVDNPKEVRPFFRELRELRDRLMDANIDGVEMKHLSMGTSWDYKVAVEEGATILRITDPIFCEDK
jgi:PLP dependent protein